MKTKLPFLLLSISLALLGAHRANAQTVQRDLQEWLDAQGTDTAVDPLLPQTPRLYGWTNNSDVNGDGIDDGQRYILWADYAGVMARPTAYGGAFAPESINGKVTERPIGDGMAEVTVQVRVKGALIWVTTWDVENRNGSWYRHDGPTVFGHRETEILADPSLEPAWADVDFTVRILNEVGAPLPDLFVTARTGRWLSFHLVINARGPLTEAFGVEEGTPGQLHWGKPGFYNNPANANADNGAAALYPNDEFHLGPVGRR